MRSLALSISLSAVLGSALGCGTSVSQPDPTPAVTVEQPPVEPVADEFELFGAALDASVERVAFQLVLTSPEAYAKKKLVTNAVVRAACQKRGCWMEVRDPDDRASAGLTVRFKNYGFFVPLNSRSADVRMEGEVSVTRMTAGQVAELEAEGGTIANKEADGSAIVVQFTASGVEMRNRVK